MKEKEFYQNIKEVLKNLPENFSILEEKIDIEVQMKYFDYVQKQRKDDNAVECFENRNELFLEGTGFERKKEILVNIATIDDVKAFRTIEQFVKESSGEIYQWAVLALQESRMLMQSSLLDEQQVFISTGLGGRGQKIRYYVVFINKNKEGLLTRTQQKLLKDELLTELKSVDGEFETIDFTEGFSSAMVMLPLQTDLKSVFRNIIDECNQYGDFLEDDMILTNVKMLSKTEITEMLSGNRNVDFDEPDEWEDFDEEEEE
jgi:hypothetical protein